MQNESSVTGFLAWEMQPIKYEYISQKIKLHDLQLPSDYHTLPATKQNLLGAINLIKYDREVEPAWHKADNTRRTDMKKEQKNTSHKTINTFM